MIKKDLSINFCNIKFENPFLLSSSPVGNCYEMCAKALETGWAGVVFKTIGFFIANEVSPRFDTLQKEGTNFVGFRNLEQIAEHSLEENLNAIKKLKKTYPNKIIIASIMGQNEDEWEKLASLVEKNGADMIECNFSCPQMTSHAMGSDVGVNPKLVKLYTEAVKRGCSIPVITKMTPNIEDISVPAIASIEGGADGVSAINTIKSIINIDENTSVARPSINGFSPVSGYSGKAVKPVALRFIHQLKSNKKLTDIELSGIGGIETWHDALEFILLGCKTVQVTTAIMQYGYRIVEDMISGLSHYMDQRNIDKLEDLVGKANQYIIPAENLDRSFIVYPKCDTNKCIRCGRCYISCYDGGHQAITLGPDRTPYTDKKKCVGCHLCSLVCPVSCISQGDIKQK